MTKKISGEVSLIAGEEKYSLRLDFSTIAEIEDHFDKGIVEVAKTISGGRVGHLAVLLSYMAEIEMDNSFDVIQAAGLEEVATKIAECITNTLAPNVPGKSKPRRTRTKKTPKA